MGLRARAAVAALTFASTLGIIDCALTQPAGRLVMTVSGVRNTNGWCAARCSTRRRLFPSPDRNGAG
jgi:hypothetical protein